MLSQALANIGYRPALSVTDSKAENSDLIRD